ncbi:MAG: putative sulfate/molybdate transporter [Nitrospinae bacterium]|nr:putative sulfate/molybdate transporter [Nitrospinota bacterium]
MAGHYAFGGRTGGSVIINGSMYLLLGLFFSGSFNGIITIFPLPILGVILFFEGLTLMRLIGDIVYPRAHFSIALLVGLIAVGLPYGFLIGMIVGTLLVLVSERYQIGFSRSQNKRREE